MRKSKELKIQNPEALTLSDCLLAYQMGYATEVAAGQFKGFKKEDKQ
jgi:hypothetical protein